MMENAGLKFTDVGPHAEEVINLFGVAIRSDGQGSEVDDICLPDGGPTSATCCERLQALTLLEHDPEKWKPVFREDCAPTRI